MKTVGKIFLVVSSLFLIWLSYAMHVWLMPPTDVKVDLPETWWTNKDPKSTDTSVRPFKIEIPQAILDDLQTRLSLLQKHTPPLEDSKFTYGFNTNALPKIIDFWKNQYNWREREKYLNQFPQFKTNIQGLDMHFIHVKPKATKDVKVIPLLLLHGWPGSVREFYRIIPLFTTPTNGYVFEIIAPSLPGYGFSEAATKMGLGAIEASVIMKNLMLRLGFSKFMIQGGDWGALIGQNIATFYPEHVIALHSNMCFLNSRLSNFFTFVGTFLPSLIVEPEYAHMMYPYYNKFKILMEEMGYMHIQATKPDTVGIALRESPVGLAAYILEKFSTWTEPKWKHLPDGGLTRKFTLTELFDNVMIYWVSGSITTSMRLYAESFREKNFNARLEELPTNVPTACAHFPNELAFQSDKILKYKFLNLTQSNHLPRGGHFAAFEEPELVANDVFLFMKKLNL